MTPLVNKAMEIAFRAHHGAVGQHDGDPYILHVHRVAQGVNSGPSTVIAIAWLHDAHEDNREEWPLARIKSVLLEAAEPRYDFQSNVDWVVQGIDAISKRSGEDLEAYYNRVKLHTGARSVKLSDIRDNFRRNHLITDEATRLRMARKYSLGLDILEG